jgi:hypothetical protein
VERTWVASSHRVRPGQQVAVTSDLYSALLQLHEHRLDVSVFVDALCINQGQEPEALRERETLVMMTGQIYSQTVHVTIDLGEKADKPVLALVFFAKSSPLTHLSGNIS